MHDKAQDVIELASSSATVALAAQALHIEEARIAKTLAFMVDTQAICVVCAGDCKIDNHACKDTFKKKANMLKEEEVETYTNHLIGGVCPFALPATTKGYPDVSLKRFDCVYPACGSAICLTIPELETLSNYQIWVDVCKGWRKEDE